MNFPKKISWAFAIKHDFLFEVAIIFWAGQKDKYQPALSLPIDGRTFFEQPITALLFLLGLTQGS